MANDAFSQGVAPGGLWSKNDIRILLCYVLRSAGAPLTREDLTRVVCQQDLANYFEVSEALDALLAQGHLAAGEEGLTVTATGREIADALDVSLPLSVRDKALTAALRLLASARTRRENRVEIAPAQGGFLVTCHISGGPAELMTVSLTVPDRAQAALVEQRFYHDPQGIYQLLLAALTGDTDFARSYFAAASADR